MPPSPHPDPRIAALDALFNPLARSDAPGLVVGVAQHGRSLYRRGIGLASVEHGVSNKPWTRMRIGSTSKQFTCLAALLLAEEGRLDIDAPVRAYLPELPVLLAQGPEPSLRQLMNHSSGYRCYLDLGFIAEGMAIKPAGVAWGLQRRQREANFVPGSQVIYCNSGYQLLSRVIEQVSGQAFEQFLQQRIFAPLGMQDTASVPSDFELHPGTATLHLPRPVAKGFGWRRGIFPTEELRGEGAMVSTIDDMLRWLAHLRAPHKRVGSSVSWQQMLAPTRLANGHDTPYGLGLMRHDYRGIEVIHHPGAVIGGASQMLTVPSQALDIILIANGAPCSPRELALRIVDAMLGDAVLGPAAAPASAERFGSVLGRRYRGRDTGLVFGFAKAGEALGLSLLEGPAMPLRDEGAQLCKPFEEGGIGQYRLPTAPLAGAVAPSHLDLVVDGRSERCELLPETPPAEAGAPLLGRYRSVELDAEARIAFDGERLLLQTRGAYGGNRFELRALSAEVFGCQALDMPLAHGGNAVLRLVPAVGPLGGPVSGFRLDTPRTRQLAFERCGD